MGGTYETDYYAWAIEQAALLRQGRLGDADVANIAETAQASVDGALAQLLRAAG